MYPIARSRRTNQHPWKQDARRIEIRSRVRCRAARHCNVLRERSMHRSCMAVCIIGVPTQPGSEGGGRTRRHLQKEGGAVLQGPPLRVSVTYKINKYSTRDAILCTVLRAAHLGKTRCNGQEEPNDIHSFINNSASRKHKFVIAGCIRGLRWNMKLDVFPLKIIICKYLQDVVHCRGRKPYLFLRL